MNSEEDKILKEFILQQAVTPQEAVDIIHKLIIVVTDYHAAGVLILHINWETVIISAGSRVSLACGGMIDTFSTAGKLQRGFIAPEVILGYDDSIRETADVYSICALLWSLLLGRPLNAQETKYPAARRKAETEYYKTSGLSVRGCRVLRRIFNIGLKLMPEKRFADLQSLRAALTEGRGFILYGKEGYYQGTVIPVTDDMLSMGRYSGCTLKYPEDMPDISGRHCLLFWRKNQLMIFDNNSVCGTYVNRKKLLPKTNQELRTGDMICLGSRRQRFIIKEISII